MILIYPWEINLNHIERENNSILGYNTKWHLIRDNNYDSLLNTSLTASILAPLAISNSAIAVWPLRKAKRRGVSPF